MCLIRMVVQQCCYIWFVDYTSNSGNKFCKVTHLENNRKSNYSTIFPIMSRAVLRHKDKKTLFAIAVELSCSGTILTFSLNLKSGVSPLQGFLFGLWCQGTGQYMRKHWWQNSADPGKPQSCVLSWRHWTVRETDLTIQTLFKSDQC